MPSSIVLLEPWHKVQWKERKRKKKKVREVPKYFCTSLRAPCISNRLELVWVHKSSRRVRGGQEADNKLQFEEGEKKKKKRNSQLGNWQKTPKPNKTETWAGN